MTIDAIMVKRRYRMRGDVVDVVAIIAGKTPRSARVRYVMREKHRPGGTLEVGEIGKLGIVNFVAWGAPASTHLP